MTICDTALPETVLDEHTVALFLRVPAEQVVLLQAIVEMYEGVGVVRTIDIRNSSVCVVTTRDQLEDCRRLLESIREIISWQVDEAAIGKSDLAFVSYGEPV